MQGPSLRRLIGSREPAACFSLSFSLASSSTLVFLHLLPSHAFTVLFDHAPWLGSTLESLPGPRQANENRMTFCTGKVQMGLIRINKVWGHKCSYKLGPLQTKADSVPVFSYISLITHSFFLASVSSPRFSTIR